MISFCEPRVSLDDFEWSFSWDGDLVVNGGALDEGRERDVWCRAECLEKSRNIHAAKVEPIVDAVVVISSEKMFMPIFESKRGEHSEFEMEVCTGAIDTCASVSHPSDRRSGKYTLSGIDSDVGKMGVEAEKGAVSPVVFDDEILTVVALAGAPRGIGHHTGPNSSHFVERFSSRTTSDGFDVDSFVESCSDNAFRSADHVADKTVLTSLPWPTGNALEGAVGVHVEFFGIGSENFLVVGGELELERLA